jgi:uncharacterized protein (DUF302 family)
MIKYGNGHSKTPRLKESAQMFRYILFFFLAPILASNSYGAIAVGDIAKDSPVIVYKAQGEFSDIKEDLELAIADRGLQVSGTLHISDMLERTGEDLGYPRSVYRKAESIEFCSASVSHLMVSTHPANAVICPFTIAIYILFDEPDTVYVAFRKPYLAGEASKVLQVIYELMDGIVQDAIE